MAVHNKRKAIKFPASATGQVLQDDGAFHAPSGGSLSDGDYGDIVVSGSGTVLSIDSSVNLPGNPTTTTQTAGNNTTRIATTAYVMAAVAALINSAPGALDTLKELADAINDDASFAATVTTALALKAPLASPALTGNPTAPTQSAGNSSTRLSTTAFVAAAVAAAALVETTITITTGSLANGASESGTISIGRSFVVKKVTVDQNSEVRLYGSSASRAADSSRVFGDLSFIGTMSEYILGLKLNGTTGLTWFMSPPAYGANCDGPTSATIYYKITNNSGSTHTVTATLKVIILEA